MTADTMPIAGPPINRWPFLPAAGLLGTPMIVLIRPSIVVVYDLWSNRRVQRAPVIPTGLFNFKALNMILLGSLPF